MGVLDRFEKGIERAVNGAFAKAFRSEVQPVEIASALRRECDDKAAIVGRERTIVPNTFVVELGQADHNRLGQWTDALGDELGSVIADHARQQRYSFVGPISIRFEQAEDLDTGVFRVRSSTTKRDGQPHDPRAAAWPDQAGQAAPGVQPGQPPVAAPPVGAPPVAPPPIAAPPIAAPPVAAPPVAPPGWVQQAPPPAPAYADPVVADTTVRPGPPPYPAAPAPPPVLDVDGQRYELTKPVLVIGRGLDADVVLDDPGVSRRHAEIHVVDGRARIIDLGSTNGTYVDGEKHPVSSLHEGSTITIGRTRMTFHTRR